MVTEHTHHWLIQPPQGTFSPGHCTICGEAKWFRNAPDFYAWYNHPTGEAAAKSIPKLEAALDSSTGRTWPKYLMED